MTEKNTAEEKIIISQKDEQRLRSLRLLDDDFMKMVFDNNIEATELLLNAFLGREDIRLLQAVSEREIKNPNGRSVRLDIYAEDTRGCHYDIEVQRQDRGAGERRARFNSSMMDTKLLKEGQETATLPDSYVIFITEHDVRGQGKPLYHYRRADERENGAFRDGSHIIYVNGAYQNENDRIGRLMHDFRCTDPDDMYHKVLADRVRYFKEQGGGQGKMCKVWEEIREEAAKARNIEIATDMIKDSQLSLELIAKYCSLSLQEVQELAERKSA